jgi:hypothetical protein
MLAPEVGNVEAVHAWVSREWIKRVLGDESAEAFGGRASRESDR